MVGYTELIQNTNIDRHTTLVIPENIIEMIAAITRRISGRTLVPNSNLGELALGQENTTCFTVVTGEENYLNTEIQDKYEKIVMFSPIGWKRQESNYRSEIAYFDKTLPLLKDDGVMIAIVAQNFLSAPLFKPTRETILSQYSLEAVIDLGPILRPCSNFPFSLLIIKNKLQASTVFLSSLVQTPDAVQQYLSHSGDCWHPSAEIIDRFDVSYYDSTYTEIRKAILNRDTVHLGDIAEVFRGVMINARERLETGKYVIIKPQHIYDGKVHLGNDRVSYCSEDFFMSTRGADRALLQPGDIVVSLLGKISWARYSGEAKIAIANQNIAIIRVRNTNQQMFNLFFSSDTGVEYLETQLKYFSHYGVFNHISMHDLLGMAVPDMKTMEQAAEIARLHEYEAKVIAAFSSVGWEVEENYKTDRFCFDLALKTNGKLKAFVELKRYSVEAIRKDPKIHTQFKRYQSIVPDAALYLFVDECIFCYKNNSFIELKGLPRPSEDILDESITYATPEVTESQANIIHNNSVDGAISDKVKLAAMHGRLDEIVDLVHEVLSGQARIESKIDDIAKQIEELSRQIAGYQSLVSRQLEMVTSEEEEDRIIHAFSEECTERIVQELQKKTSNDAFKVEQQKLVNSFGNSAWAKLSEQSRTFLISAKVIFSSLLALEDLIDYSGVCLLVTKALELELSRRFCGDFVSFLRQKYRKDYSRYPTTLLDKYGKPIKAKHFTLGSVAYVLCYERADNISDEDFEKNKQALIDFCSEKILTGKDDESIMNCLHEFALQVEKVKSEYRNPAAHTNELKYVKAQECFNLIVDVEKLLRKILDSFAY